ncbi:MAG: hypothetical protein K2R98_21855 [Gemmataceae bacterium]|nr:hypothetical protein [Gemmataceae bacterium]
MSFATPRKAQRRAMLVVEELEPRQLLSYQPTPLEQVFLERLNDARANPAAYGQTIGLDLSGVAASQPLAFNTTLIQAARDHSVDMSVRNYFDHYTPDTPSLDPGDRIEAAGFTTDTGWAESIAAGYPTPEQALAGFIIDDGQPDLGHRRHLLAIDSVFGNHLQVGVGITTGSGFYGTYYTINTVSDADSRPFLTGVVYNDLNSNGVYDVGEGISGVTITVQGVGAVAAFDTGGYSFRLNPGSYTVTASGGGLASPIAQTVTVGTTNARLNFGGPGSSLPPVTPGVLPSVGIFRDGTWFLNTVQGAYSPATTFQFNFGAAGDTPVTGDWNGDGRKDVGVFRNGTWYLDLVQGAYTPQTALQFNFGGAGDIPVVGRWTGTNIDYVGVYRNGTWFLNTIHGNYSAATTLQFSFGGAGDTPVVGHWTGTSTDYVGVFRNGTWFLNTVQGGYSAATTLQFNFGGAGDKPVVGEWTNDNASHVGVFRNGTWFLNTVQGGYSAATTLQFNFGSAGDTPVIGQWLGDGIDYVGVFRAGQWYLDTVLDDYNAATAIAIAFGSGRDRPVVGRW